MDDEERLDLSLRADLLMGYAHRGTFVTGTDSTKKVLSFAEKYKIKVIRHDCTKSKGREDMDARETLRTAAKAIETANNDGKTMLLLDEFASMPPSAEQSLHGFLDSGVVDTDLKQYKLKDGATLLVVATTTIPYAERKSKIEHFDRWAFIKLRFQSISGTGTWE